MNLFTKQKTSFLLIISLLFGLELLGQTITDVVLFANKQFEEQNYSIASKEYNRAFFFGYEQQDFLSLQIANCYLKLNDLEQAALFYDKAYRLSKNDSLKNEALLGNAFCMLVQEKYILALSELLNLSENSNQQQLIHYHFLKGIAHYGLGEDSISYFEFKETLALSGLSSEATMQLEMEFNKVYRYQKRYNSKTAYILSGIVPGSGQFYSGSVKDGINSILLIGGLYLIALEVIQYYSFLDAAIALFPWVQRYYIGGMEKSKGLAISKLEEKRFESYEKIIALTLPESY